MALTDEHARTVKEQLLKQLESFPEDKREEIKQYVTSMNNEQLEEFIIKNKLVKPAQQSEGSQKKSGSIGNECVYCLIANKQIESLALYEDKDYVAVLEINPFSKGHTIIVPKKHLAETKLLKPKAFTIADKIGKHLIKNLDAENFQISSSDELKHAIINVIPVYKGKPLDYQRKPAKKQDLQDLAMKIGAVKKRGGVPKEKKQAPKLNESKIKSTMLKFERRIP